MAAPLKSIVSGRPLAVALAVSAALVWTTLSGDVMHGLGGLAGQVPYGGSVLASLSDVLVMVALAALAAGRSPLAILSLAGLSSPVRRPLLWAVIWIAPAVAICLIWARLAPDLKAADIAWLSIGGPFVEELVYRGLAVGVLMRVCGWRGPAACLWPALFFGLVHVWQGSDPGTIAGVVAITALGGLTFGWLFIRWNFNLWPPVLLHVGLNLLWQVFNLGDNAIGGWVGNAERIVAVMTAIAATFWLAPRDPAVPGGD